MKNEFHAFESRVERHARRKRAERLLLHPTTIAASALLGLALVSVPLSLTQADASARAEKILRASAEASAVAQRSAPTKPPQADAAAAATSKPKNRTKLIAFYAPWGDEGYRSLERNIDKIDVLMPMWYHLGNDGKVRSGNPKDEARVRRLIARENPDIKIMPIVNNYDKRTETWNPEQIDRRLRNAGQRRLMAKRIVKAMKAKGYDGVNIDFEGFEPKSRRRIVQFMGELYPRAKKAKLEVSQDVIVGSKTYDHKALSRKVDYLIPMMYDEHWKTSPPGPIASQGWYEKTLRKFVKLVGPEKVVVGMGTYAYNWGRPGQRAKALTYREAIALARKVDKPIKLHPRELNSTFSYKSGGVKRQVWILDAASAYNQVQAANELGVRGFAIWRIGAEDGELWDVLPNRDNLDASVANKLESSRRSVQRDPDSGLLVKQRIAP